MLTSVKSCCMWRNKIHFLNLHITSMTTNIAGIACAADKLGLLKPTSINISPHFELLLNPHSSSWIWPTNSPTIQCHMYYCLQSSTQWSFGRFRPAGCCECVYKNVLSTQPISSQNSCPSMPSFCYSLMLKYTKKVMNRVFSFI